MSQLDSHDCFPSAAWDLLKADPESVLVDVRTDAEWHYVGGPDLASIKKTVIKLEWRTLPEMDLNESFAERLASLITDKDTNILFLCRTGGRSGEAAALMTELGYKNCYNIIDGFEGAVDPRGHRGNITGWKASHLPWRQD